MKQSNPDLFFLTRPWFFIFNQTLMEKYFAGL